ncbi:cellobiose phosphorylase [Anaerobacillus sp. CMMVII]|uniref:GH36-type glycosyl hydrolase domain-containing protein n=1 Tax=Anaerobacillus sp. CMMVII TaxID=2755588 RepID=UPI0021B7BD86|nr:amylo-alpha-1,6-glucosidase [Anaerobacillus sp. CMMVII]MCT8137586.1 cellobiose phosphorylase [Anaerobacillus sp. CMMVII]
MGETALATKNKNIQAGNYSFTFLNTGDLYEATHDNTLINQWLSNTIDGSFNNIYVRVHHEGEIKVAPLLGVRSNSKVQFREQQVIYYGTFEEVEYQVAFHLTEHGIWFWDVSLTGSNVEVDLMYGQDVGIADKGAVRTNEAYLSQYIDHVIFEDASKGYVACSRQNQKQSGGFPYLQQGSLTKAVGYSTDGFQFFGLSYKETNEPEVLQKSSLPNEVYQYEFAYTGLQTEKAMLAEEKQFVFYGLFKPDYPNAITSLEFGDEVTKAWEQVEMVKADRSFTTEKVAVSHLIGKPLQTISVTTEDLEELFPNRIQEEWKDESLLSFFTPTHEHIVLKEKELVVERPHGHILMSGQNDQLKGDTITTTSYMYGVFNSQLVVGNTSFNKMLTNTRNALNVSKTSGQRIYVELEGTYHLLTMPSLFEIGFNYARWYYKTEAETFIISNFTTVDTPEVQLDVRSKSGKKYRFVVTNQISMNNNEYEVPYQLEKEGQILTITATPGSDSAGVYPNLAYRIHVDGAEYTLRDESILVANSTPTSAPLVVLEVKATNEWSMTFQGLLHGEDLPYVKKNIDAEIERYRDFYREVMNGFELSLNDTIPSELEKMNSLAWWYTHNMLVHYSVPHGLEQYGGAAWGTRDVCQGPTEYFMATQKYNIVKDIIKTVYSHQYEDNGNWPQWFMFDQYFKIQQEESHGDIIVWPLKVLGDYLNTTNDVSILEEMVPYTNRESFEFTEEKATILDHAKKQIDYIKNHFLHGTHLSSYGDGDWDDTLQPANAQLKKYMVSSWTVSLSYQVLKQLAQVLANINGEEAAELEALATGIEADFNRYMLQTEVIPGFIYMEEPGKVEYMLHPDDTKTRINYRLLPMTRSMISELLNPEQAEAHYQLIKEQLYCPDGVRLMDRPANYSGGVSNHFKRAETAANFGREVGLQYVHAHIRFVEAMAKLGKVEEVWDGLQKINPVKLKDVVPNADYRQSNAYFSSSDGKFNTRYEAQENFDQLRDGSVKVKGGWRIYSSGPGIYMNQLISNCLGIRPEKGGVVIDPMLPQRFDGLTFNYRLNERPVTFVYILSTNGEKGVRINGEAVAAEEVSNRYRQGGFYIQEAELASKLTDETNLIEITL